MADIAFSDYLYRELYGQTYILRMLWPDIQIGAFPNSATAKTY